MAKGNWDPNVIKPKPRCRLCGRVVKKSLMVRLDGIAPAHKQCCEDRGRNYTSDAEFLKSIEKPAP